MSIDHSSSSNSDDEQALQLPQLPQFPQFQFPQFQLPQIPDVLNFINDPEWDAIDAELERVIASERVPRPVRQKRRHIYRDHEGGHNRLWADYFSENPRYPPDVFRRRFRMHRPLFLHIVNTLAERYPYFQLRRDAAGKLGLSPLQKCTVAIRQLAYGGSADMFDEYLQCGETTGNECLKNFCEGVRNIFGPYFLRKPNAADVQFLLDWHYRMHGFPGMLGSIDCMHWQWKNCPVAWRAQFTTGFKGTHPTIILEAVADQRLWIWHAYFGVAGSNNDLNVLNSSPLFNEQCNGTGPAVQFSVNGNDYDMGYYLSDGIYPQWPVFLKSIKCPTGDKRKNFAIRQESARKDVERAFGVLQSRFALIKGGARFFYEGDLADIMYACIILHNMIIYNEHDQAAHVTDDPSVATTSRGGVASEPVAQGVPYDEDARFRAFASIHQKEKHRALQHDMIEELWANRNRNHRS